MIQCGEEKKNQHLFVCFIQSREESKNQHLFVCLVQGGEDIIKTWKMNETRFMMRARKAKKEIIMLIRNDDINQQIRDHDRRWKTFVPALDMTLDDDYIDVQRS